MIHAKLVQPRIFPHNSARVPEQIDRAQDIGGDIALKTTKLYEIGRDGQLGTRKETPTLTYSMTQFEYGSMDFFYAIANVENPASNGLQNYVDLDDFSTTTFDISAYMTDDDNTFRGTMWFPNLRVDGLSINVSAPDAAVERKFSLVGEDFKILDGKYFAYESDVAGGAGVQTIVLNPVAVEYASGDYIFKVLRIRAGVCTTLVEDNASAYADDTWRYDVGTTSVIVQGAETSDLVKVYYEAATAYGTLWTDNDVDSESLMADSCEIYMKVGTGSSARIYRLQNIGIDVKFDRSDWREIGNKEVVQRGIKAKTVTVSLDRFNEGFSMETMLADNTAYPYIDPREFSDDIQVMLKVFSDSTHTTFKMGYLLEDLSPTSLKTAQAIEDYNKLTDTLEGSTMKISDDESEIVFA